MNTTRIAIVGAGLSGLYAAYLLERSGIQDYVLFDARPMTGGRIATASAAAWPAAPGKAAATTRFDLGPTWFWPDYQREFGELVSELKLERFEQYASGSMLVERTSDGLASRMQSYPSSPRSMRLVGGMSSLIEALRTRLDPARVVLGHTVRYLTLVDQYVEIDVEYAAGAAGTWRASHVLLAVPPRLAVESIEFSPSLPAALVGDWSATPTWMAPHAKYVAVYDHAFWRDQGLSGEARSAKGPMGEIHDASVPGGSAALFGFLGVPARVRKTVLDDILRAHCRAQLARLFGPEAQQPRAEFLKDWAQDPWTATEADLEAEPQAGTPPSVAADGPWRGRLTGIASEWSPQFPGYLAGAIEAAEVGIRAVGESQ